MNLKTAMMKFVVNASVNIRYLLTDGSWELQNGLYCVLWNKSASNEKIVKTGSLSFKLLLSPGIKLISWEIDIYKKKLQTHDKIKILSLMYKSPQGLLYMCSRHISFFNSINQSSFTATFTSVARFCKEEPKTQRLGNRW